MDFINSTRVAKEYRLFVIDNQIQLHHIVCNGANTKVADWPKNFPGGVRLDDINDLIDRHEPEVHGRYVDG